MKKSIMFLFVASVFSASYAEKVDITTTTTITTDSASEYYYENYNNDTIYIDPDSSITLNLGSATEPMPGLTLVNGDDNLASLTAIGAQNQIPTVNFYGYTIVDDVRLERIYSFNVKSDATLKVNGSINSVFNQYERSNKITFDAGSKTTVEGSMDLNCGVYTVNGDLTVKNGLYFTGFNSNWQTDIEFGKDASFTGNIFFTDADIDGNKDNGDGRMAIFNITTLGSALENQTLNIASGLNQWNQTRVVFDFISGSETANGQVHIGALHLTNNAIVTINLFDNDADDIDGVSDSVKIDNILILDGGGAYLSLVLNDFENDLLQFGDSTLGSAISVNDAGTALVVDGKNIALTVNSGADSYTDGFFMTENGFLNNTNFQVQVPEPSTYAMMFGGIALGFAMYRRRK